MEKWNIPTYRAQIINETNICVVIMFTPRVRVIKMSQMARFCFVLFFLFFLFPFSADDNKILVTVWAKYLSGPERS